MNADADLDEPVAHFERAKDAMSVGDWPKALAAYDALLRLEPGHVPSLNNRGIVLSSLGRHAEALASFEAVLAINPDDPLALNNRGEELQRLMRPDEALASYDAAIALAPDFPEAHGNRGHLLSQLGRIGEAIQALERAIQIEPANPRFYQHLAPLRRFDAGDPLIKQMQRLAARPGLSPEGRVELGFALAKALGDTGAHDQAFEELARANGLKRSGFDYDEAATLGELERIGRLFGEDFLARTVGAGDPGPAPIMIVGMPRSGSTLVEQILASHPKVFAAGERCDLDDAIAEALQRAGAEPFPEGAAGLTPRAIGDLGRDYAQRLGALAPSAERIVDKRLSNFRHLGLVHAALPGARFVYVRRDPVDACMSCYSRLFGGDQPFAYDLGELGRYHRALDDLMRWWRELLPATAFLELDYEALVADPEPEVRRLLAHCGLEWDPSCLEFHRTQRQVRTSSASQVRRPLYTGAIGASRPYLRRLGPLLEALDAKPQDRSAATVVGEAGQAEGEASVMAIDKLERKAAAGDLAAQRALAERLDGEGRHTEAIDWLARAGRAGDVEALTRVAVRLLIGLNAPFLPADGARLLANAADAGGAEAMERLAVLIGGGFYARQSWAAALELLASAAEQGSSSAQAQLQLLAGARSEGAAWTDLGRSVDVRSWTTAPEPRVLSQSPRVLAVSRLVSADVCDWIVAQAAARLERAELYDPRTGRPVLGTETRLNRIANFNLAETNLANLFVQARMAAAIGAPIPMLEAFAVLHYAPGEEYGEHVDFLDPAIPAYAAELAQRGQRVATCLIYLNDDYEGGETEFPKLGLSFKGKKGDALIFFSTDHSGRPDPRTVHAGRTPTSGEKWLLSQFFRDRPVVGVAPRRA